MSARVQRVGFARRSLGNVRPRPVCRLERGGIPDDDANEQKGDGRNDGDTSRSQTTLQQISILLTVIRLLSLKE